VQFSGGLGNQILNLGVLIWLETNLNERVICDTSRFDTSEGISAELKHHEPRKLSFSNLIFDFKGEVYKVDYRSYPENSKKILEYKARIWLQKYFHYFLREYWVSPFAYDPKLLKLHGSKRIKGNLLNFQYLNFAIQNGLSNPRPARPSKRYFELIDYIKLNNPVGVHIRGGDFAVAYPQYVPTMSYYSEALKYMADKSDPVLVFTDDMEMARSLMKACGILNEQVIFTRDSFRTNAYEEYVAITNLNRLITSSSSFSGSASRFIRGDNSIVIVPDRLLELYKISTLPENHLVISENGIILNAASK
jgi:hypothetical protein